MKKLNREKLIKEIELLIAKEEEFMERCDEAEFERFKNNTMDPFFEKNADFMEALRKVEAFKQVLNLL